jgi:CrcB protein
MNPLLRLLADVALDPLGFPAPARSGKVQTMQTLLALVFVGLGSMLGGLSRYGMTLATQNLSAFSIPYGTLVSNVAGCLVIGLIAGISGKSELLSTEMRLLLATGFCGGFTTMSSFIYEIGQFVQDKEYFFASTYFVATLAGAGIAFALGLLIIEFATR